MHFDETLLRSTEAFRSLNKWSLLVYLDFLRMRKMVKVRDSWIIENNGKLVYPYAVAERKGIKPREFRRALEELINKGFLDIAEYGSGGVKGATHKFILDDRWTRYGKPDFKPAKNPMIKDPRRGRGFQVGNKLNPHSKNHSSLSKMTAKRMSIMTAEIDFSDPEAYVDFDSGLMVKGDLTK